MDVASETRTGVTPPQLRQTSQLPQLSGEKKVKKTTKVSAVPLKFQPPAPAVVQSVQGSLQQRPTLDGHSRPSIPNKSPVTITKKPVKKVSQGKIIPTGLSGLPSATQQPDFVKNLLSNLASITGKSLNETASNLLSPMKVPSKQASKKLPVSSKLGSTPSTSKAGTEQPKPGTWMDWFIEQSGSEGIQENLAGPKVRTKPAKKPPFLKGQIITPDGHVVGIPRKKRKSTPCVRRKMDHILQPEEVTKEMLDRVAWIPKDKKHDQECGTSCHQCRQKTSDTKTICRSGKCVGLRGFFCGPCLNGRYGEDAREALLNPDWNCPVCRGICNCSLCRKAQKQQNLPAATSVPSSIQNPGGIARTSASTTPENNEENDVIYDGVSNKNPPGTSAPSSSDPISTSPENNIENVVVYDGVSNTAEDNDDTDPLSFTSGDIVDLDGRSIPDEIDITDDVTIEEFKIETID